MQFINTAIEFTTIASVLFFGSLFVSGLVNRYRPAIKSATVAEMPEVRFIPNPDGFAEATAEDAALVEAHQVYVAQYWVQHPTNNVVPFVCHQSAVVVDWAKLSPFDLRKECQKYGIRWRNAHGRNRHLSKPEMVAALERQQAC